MWKSRFFHRLSHIFADSEPVRTYILGLRIVEALMATVVGVAVFREPLTLSSGLGILLILATEFYPRLPAECWEQITQEEFGRFLEQFFILTGDLESPNRASPKGEKHGFLNSARGVFFNDDETGYVCCVAPGRGCEAYVQKRLARLCPEMREMGGKKQEKRDFEKNSEFH